MPEKAFQVARTAAGSVGACYKNKSDAVHIGLRGTVGLEPPMIEGKLGLP